jgi:hypothetical protein
MNEIRAPRVSGDDRRDEPVHYESGTIWLGSASGETSLKGRTARERISERV